MALLQITRQTEIVQAVTQGSKGISNLLTRALIIQTGPEGDPVFDSVRFCLEISFK